MKPDAKLMAAIISAIDAYLQMEQGQSSPISAESGRVPVKGN